MANAATIYKVTPRQAKAFIIECFEAGLVPFLRGSPGIGKSAIFRQVARELMLWLIDHRASTSDPTDYNGLPMRDANGNAYFAPFRELFPLDDAKIPDGYQGWLIFLDEFNSASKAVMAATYKTILDKMVGQRKLHPCVVLALAGNLDTDRAIVNVISTALESRVVHFELIVDFDDWEQDVALVEDYDFRVIAYLRQYKSALMDFKPDHDDKTYCCPRTWEFINRLVKGKEITSNKLPIYAGTITPGTAANFVEHAQIYKELINVKDILADPAGCRVPDNTSLKWATVSHMNEYVDENTFGDLATYANRFSLDFRVLFFRSVMVRHKSTFRHHSAFANAQLELSRYLNG